MNMETKIGTLTFRNPLILASGILGTTFSTLQRIYEAGVGAVITKSIGPKRRNGNPNPSVFALQEIKSIIHSIGLANPGYEIFRTDIEKLVEKGVPTIVSIFGENKEEYVEVLSGIKDLPIQAFEVNLNSPITDKEGLLAETDPETVTDIISSLRKETNIPLWVKFSPNVSDIVEVASAAIKGGCDAIVAINTVKAMVIDIQTKMPILGGKRGGLAGAAIKPIGIRYVYDLYEHFGDKIPIIGVGGILKGDDIIEYLLAGATAVELGTSLGVAYPENMIRFFQMKVKKYMNENNYSSITEITGGAHK